MQKIKWAILGTSFISEIMASAICESQTSELVAIGSRTMEKAQEFAAQFSVPKIYTDFDALLNDADVDAVYIGLPNHLHKEWIIRAAQAGKHILCEKPFVLNASEAREAIAAVEKANVFCMEALMYRYHPLTKQLQELIQSNTIGDVKLYQAFYSANIADIANPAAGGSIRNLGCYPVSLVRLLANAEPTEILGMGRVSEKNQNDNQASVMLKFADNSMAMIATADDLEMRWQFHIYGTKGHLQVLSNPWLPAADENKIQVSLYHEPYPTDIIVDAEKSLYTYQIDFLNHNIHYHPMDCKKILADSLGNTIVLESWLDQVKTKTEEIYS